MDELLQIKTSKSLLNYFLFSIFYYKKRHLSQIKISGSKTIIVNVRIMMMMKQHYCLSSAANVKVSIYINFFLKLGGLGLV